MSVPGTVNPSSLPDVTCVKVNFTVNSTRRQKRKKKHVSEECRTNVNRELARHLDEPDGKLRKELNNSYGVKDVILPYYPLQLTMTVTFAIVSWAAIRFTDHVRQGTVATVIGRHLKSESSSTDSWELFGKVLSVDSNEEEDGGDDVVDGIVDSGAGREVSASAGPDALPTRSSRPEVLSESQNGGSEAAVGGDPASAASQTRGACAMEGGKGEIRLLPPDYQPTSGNCEVREMCENVFSRKESRPCKPPDALASSKQIEIEASDEAPSPLINETQQQQGNNKQSVSTDHDLQRSEQGRLFDVITDKRTNDLDFFKQIKMATRPLSEILNDEGLNCAHVCLDHNRASFLGIIQAAGHWVDVSAGTAKGSSPYAGCSLREYAEQKRFRRMMRQIDSLDNHEASMGEQNSPLRLCRAGDVQGLKNAVNSGSWASIPRDSEGNSLLHWACVSGNLELVRYLVDELKVNSRSTNNKMQNALHVAVAYGRSNLVDFLLISCHLDPREVDSSMKTPTFKAAENGDDQMLRRLREAHVPFDHNVITRATKSGSIRCIRYLLEECNMDAHICDPEGKSLLMLAAESGHLKLVTYLAEQRQLSLSAVSTQKRNVLHYAAERGHVDVAQYLISKSRKQGVISQIVNQKDKHKLEQDFSLVRGLDKGRAAWHYICLLRRYLSLYETSTKNGKVDASMVSTIVKSGWGHEPEVPILREAVQDFKQTTVTKDGEDDLTPLMLALVKGHGSVALLLLDNGADPKVTDCFGQTSMHLAAMRGLLEVAVQLQNLGVPLDVADADGYTPVHVARENEHDDVFWFLSDSDIQLVLVSLMS